MIYGVFYGWYSDWDAVGYFTNEKQAEEYCKKMNRKKSEDYFVKPLSALDGTEEPKKRIAWEVDMETGAVARESWLDDEIPNDNGKPYRVSWYGDKVLLWLYPGEETKAVKIAQDYLAQLKAEREGL